VAFAMHGNWNKTVDKAHEKMPGKIHQLQAYQ